MLQFIKEPKKILLSLLSLKTLSSSGLPLSNSWSIIHFWEQIFSIVAFGELFTDQFQKVMATSENMMQSKCKTQSRRYN